MNLHRLLAARAAAGNPVRVGLIGAGKFGTMYLAQARTTPGVHVVAVADLEPERARGAFRGTGWPEEKCQAVSFDDAGRRCDHKHAVPCEGRQPLPPRR